MNRAKVSGDIISNWFAYLGDNGKAFYANHKTMPYFLVSYSLMRLLSQSMPMKLKETLIFVYQCKFGVKSAGSSMENKLLRYVPDKKSSVVIDGDITGKSLILSAFGGHTTVKVH